MATKDFPEYSELQNPIYGYDPIYQNLTKEEEEKVRQKLLSGIASIGYDIAPITGEIRSAEYAKEQALDLIRNIKSKD